MQFTTIHGISAKTNVSEDNLQRIAKIAHREIRLAQWNDSYGVRVGQTVAVGLDFGLLGVGGVTVVAVGGGYEVIFSAVAGGGVVEEVRTQGEEFAKEIYVLGRGAPTALPPGAIVACSRNDTNGTHALQGGNISITLHSIITQLFTDYIMSLNLTSNETEVLLGARFDVFSNYSDAIVSGSSNLEHILGQDFLADFYRSTAGGIVRFRLRSGLGALLSINPVASGAHSYWHVVIETEEALPLMPPLVLKAKEDVVVRRFMLAGVALVLVFMMLTWWTLRILVTKPLEALDLQLMCAVRMDVDRNQPEFEASQSPLTEIYEVHRRIRKFLNMLREIRQYLPQTFLEHLDEQDDSSEYCFSEDFEDDISDMMHSPRHPSLGQVDCAIRTTGDISSHLGDNNGALTHSPSISFGQQAYQRSFIEREASKMQLDNNLALPFGNDEGASEHTIELGGHEENGENGVKIERKRHRKMRSPGAFTLAKKHVTQVSIGLRDFQEHVKALQDSAAIVECLTTWLQCCTMDAKDFGGNLERFVGDCLEVNFGGLSQCSRASAAATKYALRIRDRVLGTTLLGAAETEPCIGIATGPALVGTLGGVGIKSPAVLGRTIQISHAMQTISREMGIDIVADANHADELHGSFSLLPVDYIKFSETGKKHLVYFVSGFLSDNGEEWMYCLREASGSYEDIFMSLQKAGGENEPTLISLIASMESQPDPIAKVVTARWRYYMEESRVLTGSNPTEYCRQYRGKGLTLASPEEWRKKGFALGACRLNYGMTIVDDIENAEMAISICPPEG